MNTRKVLVTLGQDTPAYVDLDLAVPTDATPDQIIQIAKEKAISFAEGDEDNVQFIPSYDWTGLRIVAITESTPEGLAYLAEDVVIESSGEDLGIVAKGVLTGTVPASALLQEAERQGINVCPNLSRLLANDQVTEVAGGVQIAAFTPFSLVVDAFVCDGDADGPSYAEIEVTPALFGQIIRVAGIANKTGIKSAHLESDDSVWSDPGESLRMRGTDLVIMPSLGALQETSFFWQGHPKHASYNCETRAIDLKDLLACIGNAGTDLPNGFRRERDVLFYDAESGEMDYLVEQYFDANESEDEGPEPWVIYHHGEPHGAQFWSNEEGWTNLEGATRFAEMPQAPYPMGGPKKTQAGALCIGTMLPFTVMLRGTEESGHGRIRFDCFAESDEHAIEQAQNAYPGNLGVESVLLTETLED